MPRILHAGDEEGAKASNHDSVPPKDPYSRPSVVYEGCGKGLPMTSLLYLSTMSPLGPVDHPTVSIQALEG